MKKLDVKMCLFHILISILHGYSFFLSLASEVEPALEISWTQVCNEDISNIQCKIDNFYIIAIK